MQAEYKVVFNRKKKLNSKGKALVQIEVYLEGNRKYFSTDIYVTPQEWKPSPLKAKYITDAYKNKLILDKIQELMNFEQKCRFNNNGKFLLSEFDILSQPKPVKPIVLTFTEFYAQQLEIEKKNILPVTLRQQKTNLDLLKEYCPVIAFEDLTYALIEGYDQFLKSRKGRDGNGMKLNSVDKRHRQMKKYIALAINHGHLPYDQNPYLKFKSKKESVNKAWLSNQEWERLENLTFDSQSTPLIELVKDMFLFSTYTGLRYSDVHNLKKESFQNTEEGLELVITAMKTNKPFRLPLSHLFDGKPQEIANKYLKRNKDRLFHGITNPKANKLIKEIAKLAKINKYLTFHTSRHTFATHMVHKVGLLYAQSLLQHGDIKTTSGYLHVDLKEMFEQLKSTDWKK
ncbi:site-specific integrase [Emticicia sp. SJ17W-69]|uniref:site-specific integrase n=1 Tax=Emticicia sp. SJ17W-69 TaxID=3421657 RepID=UPI003EBE76A9